MTLATPRMEDCPYRGLMPYSEEDQPFFFGRDGEREIIIANLMASRLTLLYGVSGVGKSSVLRAGVAHHLRQLARQQSAELGGPEFAVVVVNSWRDDPVAGLAERCRESVAQALDLPTLEAAPASPTLARTLQAWTDRLGGDLLVILDQFEEYFLYHAGEDGDGTFAVEFPRAVNRPDLRVNFLVSIREDALARLDLFKGRIPHLYENYLRIEHLDREAAREAILKPVEQYNRLRTGEGRPFRVEPGLVEAVLDQVATGQVVLGDTGRGAVAMTKSEPAASARIETPYLQLVMTRLWEEERRAGSDSLHLTTLARLGGAGQIVKTHLDAGMRELSSPEQDIAAQAFRYLVTPTGTKIAHRVADLVEYAGVPEARLTPVLEKLTGSGFRILRAVAPSRYEIYHDVLAPAVMDWRRRYAEDQARETIRREESERREQERLRAEKRLMKRTLALLCLLVIILGVMSFLAFRERNRAVRERDRAGAAERQATEASELAQRRLDRIIRGIQLKQAALSSDPGQVQAVLKSDAVNRSIVFKASRAPRGYADGLGRPIYLFRLFPEPRSVPEGLDSIAVITYKMDHPTFQNSLLATGPDRKFVASYDGWGCLSQVIVVIEYADPSKAPEIASFDMCGALKGA